MMGSSHLAAYLTKGQKTGIKTDKRDKRKKVKKEGSDEPSFFDGRILTHL